MSFNHSKLLGKMRECGYTQEKLAEAIKMNKSTLSQKLTNKSHFGADEIDKICELLNISREDIGIYFFTQ